MKTKIDSIVKEYTILRKANNNKWFILSVVVDDITIKAKCYDTWIQRLEVTYPDGQLIDSSVCDLSVKAVNEWLAGSLEYVFKKVQA